MLVGSPLAGDINWMETIVIAKHPLIYILSPLAGDINWMETILNPRDQELIPGVSPHSLGTLIEWKR